jgi:flagella basal body P-ring formation protein FlgA
MVGVGHDMQNRVVVRVASIQQILVLFELSKEQLNVGKCKVKERRLPIRCHRVDVSLVSPNQLARQRRVKIVESLHQGRFSTFANRVHWNVIFLKENLNQGEVAPWEKKLRLE